MAQAFGHEALGFGVGADIASGADGGAVEGGGGAGEVELAFQGPALEQAVDKAGVEDVSGSGGVDGGDAVGGGVMHLGAVPGEDAAFAERGGGEFCAVAEMHVAEGELKVGLGHEAARKVAADDGVIDEGEELFNAGVELIEIGDDGDAGFPGPAGGEDGGSGIVAIDVEGAGGDDPFATKVVGLEDEAVIAVAEDGALSIGIDEDEGLGAGAAGNGDELGFDAGSREGLVMEAGGIVVAEFANVAGLEAPVLAGDDGGGDLAAGEDGAVAILSL